jgi:bifunctional NMN adenylyltransferase/nudix hydrolase
MKTVGKADTRYDVGVVVGRFHVHELHEGHKQLMAEVIKSHDRVMVFIGLAHLRNTLKNPLDFRARRQMFSESYPNIDVHYIEDTEDDGVWSKRLDSEVCKHTSPNQKIVLYGSRDSFLKAYKGRYDTRELEAEIFVSATEIRRRVCNSYFPTKDYRAGMIAATDNRYPTAYQTVDVAVFNNNETELLLARKPDEKGWRFIGGFSDPRSESLEADARREVKEEAGGIEITEPVYVGSTLIDDWRYRNEVDKIKTALFKANFVFGRPEGGDDVAEVKWWKVAELKRNDVMKLHHPLLDKLGICK